MSFVRKLWNDEAGFVVSSELVLVATILVVGMIAGLVTVRDQVVQELADVAGAISDVDQSYQYTGVTAHNSSTSGSDFTDLLDNCDADGQADADTGSNCVDVTAPNDTDEGSN